MISENGLETLKNIYDALNGESGPFPELECSGAVLKELNMAGFIEYASGRSVSITPNGEKYLENTLRCR